MEHVYVNLEERGRAPAPRFSRSRALACCNALAFAVFALATAALRRFPVYGCALDAKWRLLFYGLWPLVFLSVAAALAIDFRRPSWTDPTHGCMIAASTLGVLWLLLTLVGHFGSFLLRLAALSAMLCALWRWWASLDIAQFETHTLFYLNRNVAALFLGWCHVNLCFLLYAVVALKLQHFGAITAGLYVLALLAGLLGFTGWVFAAERMFGLKGFAGFGLASLAGWLVFCCG